MSATQHAEERELAAYLIESGQAASWAELGRAFGISPQAANARFGQRYKLRIPRPSRQFRRMVSVLLAEEMDTLLDQACVVSGGISRAQVVREILARELPKIAERKAA